MDLILDSKINSSFYLLNRSMVIIVYLLLITRLCYHSYTRDTQDSPKWVVRVGVERRGHTSDVLYKVDHDLGLTYTTSLGLHALLPHVPLAA